jgi:hypothetical protein
MLRSVSVGVDLERREDVLGHALAVVIQDRHALARLAKGWARRRRVLADIELR